MATLRLSDLLDGVPGLRVQGNAHVTINEVRDDSRLVGPGDLFVAVAGTKEDGRRFIDFLVEENSLSPYESLANQKWAEEVKRLLDTLTPIESRIIRWRFGLDNEDELTLKEIGDKYNLSRERIRQLQEQALGKIRKHMRE